VRISPRKNKYERFSRPFLFAQRFRIHKKTDERGYEYWEARALMPLLGYIKWQKFQEAIRRAQATCLATSQSLADHFTGADKMVEIGSKTRGNDLRR